MIVFCASLDNQVASEVEYSVQVVANFHNTFGVLDSCFAHCAILGDTISAHLAIAFPVARATGFITLPLLESPPRTTAGSATSQNPLACSCTC